MFVQLLFNCSNVLLKANSNIEKFNFHKANWNCMEVDSQHWKKIIQMDYKM